MQRKKTLTFAILLVVLGIIMSYYILYKESTKNLSLDLYELYTTINEDGTIKYRATVKAENFFGDSIKLNHVSFSINDTILDHDSISLLLKDNSVYILVNGTTTNTELRKTVEEYKMLDVEIEVEGRNGNGVTFQGSYGRVIKLYYHAFGTNTYYFTKFDIFGING